MTPRSEIATSYRLDERGIVRSPGKFQGEPWFVVSLREAALDGCADRELDDGIVAIAIFDIDTDLHALIGDAATAKRTIAIWENEQGFCYHAFDFDESEVSE